MANINRYQLSCTIGLSYLLQHMALNASSTNDNLLWNRFRQGEDVALGQLMQRHFSALYHYGCSFCQKPELVDDAIQELFFDLWQSRATLPEVHYVKTYLLSVLRNRLTNELRRPNRFLLRDEWTNQGLDFESEFIIESQLIEDDQQQTRTIQRPLEQLT